MGVHVEVCVTSVEEALAAERAGADSVEICTWLACGGITPSYGLVNTLTQRVSIKHRVLVRPTPGAFCYAEDERQMLLRDAMLIGINGVGLVTGALTVDGAVDALLLRGVKLAAPESGITFHRAIDHAEDMEAAFETCVQLGLYRVLTSGGETLAMDGANMLRRLVDRANGKVIVAAAGGIGPKNVVELVERTGVPEVHFSAQRPRLVKVKKGAAMSAASAGVNFQTEPDEARIEGVLNALVNAGLR